jgi:hypothetical protein
MLERQSAVLRKAREAVSQAIAVLFDPWRGHGSTQHVLADVLGTGFGDPGTLEFLRTGDGKQ